MILEHFTPNLHHLTYEPTITTSEKTLLQARKGVFSFALPHILPPSQTWDGIHILPVYKNAADRQQHCYKHTETHAGAHRNATKHMKQQRQPRVHRKKRIPQKRLKWRSEGVYIDKVDSVIILGLPYFFCAKKREPIHQIVNQLSIIWLGHFLSAHAYVSLWELSRTLSKLHAQPKLTRLYHFITAATVLLLPVNIIFCFWIFYTHKISDWFLIYGYLV